MRQPPGASLQRWQEAVAQRLRRDEAVRQGGFMQDEAVQVALEELWSNGPVKGQVNRLKLIKRQMYDKGSLDLLPRRVLHRG
jgi:transposase